MKAVKNIKLLFTVLILKLTILSCSKSPDPLPVAPPAPGTGITVITQTAFQITANAAQSGGTITLISGGAPIIVRGICWGTSPNPTTANSKTNEGSVPGQFYSLMTGLSLATTYYVRAYATNSIGTTYGNEVNFTTLPSIIPPRVATTAITSLTPYTTVCGGSILLDGGAPVTERGVCWSTTPSPTIINTKTSDGTGGGVFISNITGLTANTQYYLRAYATNSAGTGYGDEIAFKTPEPGTVYFGCSDNNFYAVNSLTGQLKWKRTSTGGFSYAGPCYANGKIYTGGEDGFLYCMDTLNGNVLWSFFAGSTGIECDPVFDNGTVYFGSNDDTFFALDANTGSLKWQFSTNGNLSSSPVISNGVVYFGCSNSKVYALNTLNGQLVWEFQTSAMLVSSGPTLANGILYIGNRNGILYAININTGMPVWEYQVTGSLESISPTVLNNVVYVGGGNQLFSSASGSLYAINAATGQLIWETLPNTGFTSSPIIDNGRLFIGNSSDLFAVNVENGMFLWSKRIFQNGASPAVKNDVIFVGGGVAGYFYALDVSNGSERWKFPINGTFVSGPCIVTQSNVKYSGESGMQQ